MGFAIGYAVLLCILAIVAFVIAIKALLKKERFGIILGIACLLTFLATATYLASVLTTSHRIASITANIYFASNSLILADFVLLNTHFTKRKLNKYRIIIFILIVTYALYEVVAFALNIKLEFSVKLIPSTYGNIAPYFVYEMHTGFYMHLGFSYLVIAIIFFQLLATIIKLPYGYRRAYVYVFFVLLSIVAVNATFLFIPSSTIIARFDISLPGYFVLIVTIYWAHYYFSRTGLISIYNNFIAENVEQGFVLFDQDRKLIYKNKNATLMLNGIDLYEGMYLSELVKALGLDSNRRVTKKPITSQVTIKNGDERAILRLTSSALFNKKNQPIGFLFIFSDTEFESDVLTSFQSNNAFMAKLKENPNFFSCDMTLSVLDINNLGTINAQSGYSEGDIAIQDLSNLMRKHFPKRSYFVRGKEASLAVFSEGICEEDAMVICETINNESKYPIQYAVTIVPETEKLIDAVYRIRDSLNTRKVMDGKSQRSGSLTSLIKALQEVDNDTSNHVKRTQIMAEKLGTKLGLSQVEKNNLLLLSILHDIGKISVPLEILNKPTKLTDDEWAVLKNHTIKGYNIAMGSPLLSGIAKEILYHHERWDGGGYPEGLSKENIPLLSRIVSVVDSYDAMISDRAYRRGMSRGAAIEELIRCSGTQFDPNIVKAFIEILEEDKEIYETNNLKNNYSKLKEENINKSEYVNSLKFSRYTVANGNEITFIDANFTLITGYTQDDINKGLGQLDLIPIEDRISYADIVKKIMNENNTAVLEHRIRRKDGSVITVFCYGKKYFDSAVREFRDEIMIFDTCNSKTINDLVSLQQTLSED